MGGRKKKGKKKKMQSLLNQNLKSIWFQYLQVFWISHWDVEKCRVNMKFFNFSWNILAIFHPALLPTFWLCSTNSFSATPTMVHSEKDACANGTCTATHLWQSRSKWTCQSDNICRLENYISNYLSVCGTVAKWRQWGDMEADMFSQVCLFFTENCFCKRKVSFALSA